MRPTQSWRRRRVLPRSERVEPRRPAAAETRHRWALSPTACEKPQRHVSFATAPTAREKVRVRWAVAAVGHTHPLRTGTGQRKRTASPPSADRQSSAARAVIPGWVLPLGMIGGWLVFPALTQSFKTEVLGFKAPPSGTKFAFEKEAVGENVEMTEGSVK